MRSSLRRRTLRLVKQSAIVYAMTLAFIFMIEACIRFVYHLRNSRASVVAIPYMVRNSGLSPPWQDALRLLRPDPALMLKGIPSAERTYVDLYSPAPSEEARISLLSRFSTSPPGWARVSSTWQVRLNSAGFRDEEFPTAKPPGTIRIICLGDSWTFGSNVNEPESYPGRLRQLLKQDFPQARIEVLNLGMLAYSSHEGLELLRREALRLQPDFVLVGYAMNDSAIAGWRDKDLYRSNSGPEKFHLKGFLAEHLESLKLARFYADLHTFKRISMSEHLRRIANPADDFGYETWTSAAALEASDYERLEAKTRVSPSDYDANMRSIVRLIREAGATPILLHNELRPGSPYQALLQKLSAEEGISLVDSCTLLNEARQDNERLLEAMMNLGPTTEISTGVEDPQVVFRVYLADEPVADAIYIAGPHTQLGDTVPNRVRMYDDGTHGDQRAGDHVWSFSATFKPGRKIFYLYTNSGREGRWENLDVPKIRSFAIPADHHGLLYRPIETFGKVYLQADNFHTDAAGHEIIARAVENALKADDKFRTLAGSRQSIVEAVR